MLRRYLRATAAALPSVKVLLHSEHTSVKTVSAAPLAALMLRSEICMHSHGRQHCKVQQIGQSVALETALVFDMVRG